MTGETTAATAVVMNMFYTGLGIARSLGERGIAVVGLTSERGVYGNFTRYARTLACPNSRSEPEALRDFLMSLGNKFIARPVIFPTRDDDVLFLDRFRSELSRYFRLAIPESAALQISLDKWETYLAAGRAGVPTPRCWRIDGPEDLDRVLGEVSYPCVLKPRSAHQWRQGNNWRIVGARKAIGISSPEELRAEYSTIAAAGESVLLQEMIAGGDENLTIMACYFDSRSQWVTGFNTQKLVQAPEIFGTGCIVQAVDRPELIDPTKRLLEAIGFTGVAEVEYKWDEIQRKYLLIEINPRLWDQHRLGKECGADLAYLEYCEHAGLPKPPIDKRPSSAKWVAEDTFILTALRLAWRRDPKLRTLFRRAGGRRIYAIWSLRDPIPFWAYFMARFVPQLAGSGMQALWSAFQARSPAAAPRGPENVVSAKPAPRGGNYV